MQRFFKDQGHLPGGLADAFFLSADHITKGIGMIATVQNVIFAGRQNIPWNDVEKYLKRYVGQDIQVKATEDG